MMDPLEFWEENHATTGRYLTGNSPEEVLGVLLVPPQALRDKVVLNVGVGNTLQYPGLVRLGCQSIWSVDISPAALAKVTQYGPGYLPHQLADIPSEAVDIVLHRLVAQHMFDDDLRVQLAHLFRALRPSGFLALQSAGVADDAYNDVVDLDPAVVLAGGRCRSVAGMAAMIEAAGGEVFLNREVPTIPVDRKHWVFWRIYHARKRVAA